MDNELSSTVDVSELHVSEKYQSLFIPLKIPETDGVLIKHFSLVPHYTICQISSKICFL